MILNLIVSLLKHKFPDVANITTGELHEVLSTPDKEDTCLVVDTRQKSEVSVSAIKGARHLEFPASESDVRTFVEEHVTPETEMVVCYCSLGYRSSVVAHSLDTYLREKEEQKTINVYNLEGSIFKWVNEGREVRSGGGEAATYCHPFSYKWGLLGLNIARWRWS